MAKIERTNSTTLITVSCKDMFEWFTQNDLKRKRKLVALLLLS